MLWVWVVSNFRSLYRQIQWRPEGLLSLPRGRLGTSQSALLTSTS